MSNAYTTDKQAMVLATLNLNANYIPKQWNDRVYINFSNANRTFRGDTSNKIWIRNDGAVIFEKSGGTKTDAFEEDLNFLLNKINENGLNLIEK